VEGGAQTGNVSGGTDKRFGRSGKLPSMAKNIRPEFTPGYLQPYHTLSEYSRFLAEMLMCLMS
jgi:hypothetical protein